MAAKRCLGRCGRIIRAGSYCASCRPRNGSTRAWRQTRAMVLYRDAFTCQRCGSPANHVDHVQPVLVGGSSDPSTLQALCQPCNLAKGAEPPAAA